MQEIGVQTLDLPNPFLIDLEKFHEMCDPECDKKKTNLNHTGLFGTELDLVCKYLLLDYITFIHPFIHSLIQNIY